MRNAIRERIAVKIRRVGGFTFIELSIMLMVIGLVSATALQMNRIYVQEKAMQDTQGRFYNIEAALTQFLTKNGRLPCPALPSDAPTAATAGLENPACATDALESALGSCTNGYCLSPGRDANINGTPDLAYSGAVPYATLGLGMRDSIDGWGRKIKYVVSAKLTRNATYNATQGVISVVAPNGSNALGAMSPGSGQMIIMSYGPDGRRAYTLDGGLFSACPSSLAEGRDFENCNEPMDSKYFNNFERGDIAGSTHYDDLLHTTYKIVSSSDLWSMPGAVTEMQNTAGRRIGIGVATPASHLHVAGNIRASSTNAKKFCNIGGTAGTDGPPGSNCIETKLFAGSGSSCAEGSMNGIKNGVATCSISIVPSSIATGTCPTGKVMCGVTGAGAIICNFPGAATCP